LKSTTKLLKHYKNQRLKWSKNYHWDL